jgi:hypothetical protein
MWRMCELRCGFRPVRPGFLFEGLLPMVSDTRKGRGFHRKPTRAMGIFLLGGLRYPKFSSAECPQAIKREPRIDDLNLGRHLVWTKGLST